MRCLRVSPGAFIKRYIKTKKSTSQQEKEVASHPTSPSSTQHTKTPSLRPSSGSLSKTRITASSVPQWKWSNAQCKAWLYEICIGQLGCTSTNAENVCTRFTGFGPTLYAMDRGEWEALLGRYNGMGVYSMLLALRNHVGAVPENISMPLESGNHVGDAGNENDKGEKTLKRMSWRRSC